MTGLIEAMEVSVSESAPQRRIEPMSERAERRVIGVEERLERWAVARADARNPVGLRRSQGMGRFGRPRGAGI